MRVVVSIKRGIAVPEIAISILIVSLLAET